jgi:Ser/Thr protein kinase RdoA (MazF antagonist)
MFYFPKPNKIIDKLKISKDLSKTDFKEINEILKPYGIENIKNYKIPKDGNRGQNIIINTKFGKKLLKRYKSTLDKSTIIQEHSILKYLATVKFPAPRLCYSKSGNTLFKNRKKYYALFDFVEGGFHYNNYYLFPNQKSKFIASAGKILGTLHEKLNNFNSEGYNPDGFRSKKEDRYRNLDWFDSKLKFCIKKTIDINTRINEYPLNWMIQNIESLETSLSRLNFKLLQSNLPRLIIHGDYGPYNLLFFKNNGIMVLDFEMARLDWRLTEIIRAWHRFCRNKFGFNMKQMLFFLNNYHHKTLFTFAEIELVPEIWEFLSIRNSIKSWYNYCTAEKKSSLVNIKKSLSSLKWIRKNQNELVESLKHSITSNL